MNADCFVDTNVSRIKLAESGRFLIVKNDERNKYRKAKVDGCLLSQELAADWVLTKYHHGDVVIELKGSEVDHAIKQIVATIKYWHENQLASGQLAAIIVCSRYPKIDTKIQRAKVTLAKTYKAPLHVVSRNREYQFSALLSNRGPLKE